MRFLENPVYKDTAPPSFLEDLKKEATRALTEAEKTADILIINGRPERTIGDSRTIEMIIQAGRIVNRDKLRYDVNTEAGFQVFSPDAWKKK